MVLNFPDSKANGALSREPPNGKAGCWMDQNFSDGIVQKMVTES